MHWCNCGKGSRAGWLLLATVIVTMGGSTARAELRITEVMPNGTGASELDEWIEIVNTGPGAVDLSAFRVGDEETAAGGEGFYAFPVASIAAGELIIVARSASAFATTFPNASGARVFATDAAAALKLTKDVALGTGDIGLSNGTAATGDEVLLVQKIADGHYELVDGMSYGGTSGVTSYSPPGGTTVAFIDARVAGTPPELGSFARVSSAVDTNKATDWTVLASATPGAAPSNVCGDGAIQAGETCDDGNDDGDDGCSALCAIECGFSCAGTGPASCAEDCGDGDVAGLEECDDGDALPGDGCDDNCRIEVGFACTDPEPLCDASATTKSACTLDPCALPLIITEVHADGLVDPDSEWIEITNTGSIAADLGPWSFADQATAGAAGEGAIRFTQGLSLAAGATIVVASSGSRFQTDFGAAPDYEYGVDSASTAPFLHRTSDWAPNTNIQLDNASDQVVLACGGVLRDIVRWGAADALTVPAPAADYSAANPNAGPLTFERLGNALSGTAADWVVSRCPTPGDQPNPDRPPEAAGSFLVAAAGVPTTFTLAAFDAEDDALVFTLDTTGTTGTVENLGSGKVRYTGTAGTTSFGFTVSDACSTSSPARVEVLVGNPSCDAKLANVRITEVHSDARVDNDGEWIELTNTGTSSVDLGFLRVGDEEAKGGSEGMVLFPPGTLLAAGDAVVVAFSAAAFKDDWDLVADGEWYRDSDGVDNELPRAATWSEGPIRLDNSADGVLLLGCNDSVIDAVYWGHEVASGTPAQAPWAETLRPTPSWDGVSAAGPATFSRRDPGIDTDAAGDWFRELCPTPGVPRSDNDAPLADDAAYASATNATLSKTFTATDPDADALTYSATASAGNVNVTAATGAFTFTPPAGQTGYFTIAFEASDGCASSSGTVSVCVAQNPATCDLTCAPDKPDLCDGKDNDCDPASADGADDPAIGQPCDSPGDSDACTDDVRTCTAAGPACPNVADGDTARVEACDANDADEDCDGLADDADTTATGKQTFFRDQDGDGRGSNGTTQSRCDAGAGFVALGGDCDDSTSGCGNKCSPSLIESKALGNCNDHRDNDCDGETDTDGACTDDILCYLDRDGDGFGRFATEVVVSGQAAVNGCAGYNDGVNPVGSWVPNGLDCDDDPSACGAACYPDADEVCDAQDNDCDPSTADGTGDATVAVACDAVADSDECLDDRSTCDAGSVVCVNIATTDAQQLEVCDAADKDEDCDGGADDSDPNGTPASAPFWYRDRDSDGFGDAADAKQTCERPSGYVASPEDCDDDPAACGADCRPGLPDVCDNEDNDCDAGSADGAADVQVGAACDSGSDADGCLDEVSVCALGGVVACPNDPDGDANRVEVCDAADADEDCDGGADDDDPDGPPLGGGTWYADADGDGHGDESTALVACDPPAGYVDAGDDCDDDPAVCGARCHPERGETPADDGACADGFDNDCDGLTDTDPGCSGGTKCYADRDQDGYGDDSTFTTIPPIEVPAGGCVEWDDGSHTVGYWTAIAGDCTDDDDAINPDGAEVVGNDRDEDCNGALRCWVDDDNDNYARDDAPEGDAPAGETCTEAFHLAALRGDCEDVLDVCGAACSPAAIEICDDADNDCNGSTDEAEVCGPTLVGVIGGGEGCAAGGSGLLSALAALVIAVRRRRRSS